MDKKTITAVAMSAVVTLLVTAFFGYMIGVFERGSEAIDADQIMAIALDEEQIKAIIKEVMITDEEKTYAQTLAEINNRLTRMETALGILTAE